MNKIYKFDPTRYFLNVSFPAIMAGGISIYAGYKYYSGSNSLYLLVVIVCALICIDHIASLTHPKIIINNDEKIELLSFGRKHTYKWAEVKRINLRKGAFSNKIYLRIGDTNFLRGRYWLNVDMYNNGDELIDILKIKEAKLHPMLKRFNKRSTKPIR